MTAIAHETLQTDLCRSLHFRATANDGGPATFDFVLPPGREAGEPPEARGLQRDQVRLMVSHRDSDEVVHTEFRQITEHLEAGDVLVINTSATLNAALMTTRATGNPVELHLSTQLDEGLWSVELRRPAPEGTQPLYDGQPGEQLAFDAGGSARLVRPLRSGDGPETRLWIARIQVPGGVLAYLDRHGFPIRYGYVEQSWPLDFYQTAYASVPGSAEMPSAGRAFTPELITSLVARGVQVAPIVLHTGVASLEDHESPYAEWFHVPETTAQLINNARAAGRRVIAVGTTVVRAVESAVTADGSVVGKQGWTELVIHPRSQLRAVSGLLTGLHEPQATHLAMLLALAGPDHVCLTYRQALDKSYLWHEFGDLHLIL